MSKFEDLLKQVKSQGLFDDDPNYQRGEKVKPGDVYGRLTVVSRAGVKVGNMQKNGKLNTWRQYLCKCECGNGHIVTGHPLTSGQSKSCGCIHARDFVIPDETKIKANRIYQNTEISEGVFLGSLCKRKHDWRGTGKSLRRKKQKGSECICCEKERVSRPELIANRPNRPTPFCSVCGDKCTNKNMFKSAQACASHEFKKLKDNPKWIAFREEQRKAEWEAYKQTDQYKEQVKKQARKFKERYRTDPEFRKKERMKNTVWKHAHPERVAEWEEKRWKRVNRQSTGSVTRAEIKKLFAISGTMCPYCGKKMKDGKKNFMRNKTIDHIVALNNGGRHCITNLIICCRKCNITKGAKDLSDWFKEMPDRMVDRLKLKIESKKEVQLVFDV